tara:strand:- start:817 stop:1005 length:189 start_codon:yes stop_codon:yes gene_type:complete
MMVVKILTYQAVHSYMSLPPDFGNITESAALVSVCMGALTGCFGIWMNKLAAQEAEGLSADI